MEDNKAFLEHLPKEILYGLANYIDLRDLGALLFTSKRINGFFQSDLAFQKIVCEATPIRLLHMGHDRPIRVEYYDYLASLAAKYNDANIMKFALEDLSAKHIISRLRPKADYIQAEKTKLGLLTRIVSNDADKVLEFLIEKACALIDLPKKKNIQDKLTPVKNSDAIEKVFNYLIDECFGKNVRPENCTYPKIIAVVMKFINENRPFLLGVLVKRISIEPKVITILQSLLKYAKYFKYSLDLNEPIEIKIKEQYDLINFEATPLEAAAFYGLKNVFHCFMEHIALVDLLKPYLPLLLVKNMFNQEFFNYLSRLGADLNALLPKAFAPNQTILGYAIEKFNSGVVELLIFRGAKLSKDEASKFLSENSKEYQKQVAIAQLVQYDPKKRLEKIHHDQHQISFKSKHSSLTLLLMSDGKFEYYTGTNRIGHWKQDSGRLKLTSAEERRYKRFGSYGNMEVTMPADLMTVEFLVYRNFADQLSLILLGPNDDMDFNVVLQQV